ncbi:MAG: HAD-IIB family hydrolase [Desulfurivibrionaceae bacterium]|nr:HAD-IIB family hydrolase [Desulfobulbales bacterium]MDT8334278.1 HAD-IIB family hydrolase [Desulfurivibrionaceae bacterium]
MKRLLICTDLDRTLLPNGIQPESPAARPLFRKLASKPFVRLAYVSGRDFQLLREAIREFDLPEPKFMIGDVGTTIYHKPGGRWQSWPEWHEMLGGDWPGAATGELAARLAGLPGLVLQEPEKQGRFKLSYYTDPKLDSVILKNKVLSRLENCSIKVRSVFSVDEVNRVGLFDLLPETASKLAAVRFIISRSGVAPERTVYAGDSGNDLEVLTSEVKAILVANAIEAVRRQARQEAPTGTLYLAEGGFMDMNGNYAAGLLEGVVHYLPELGPVLKNDMR